MKQAKPDYLAVILIGGGSSWGRDPDKETAIQNALKALQDWEVYYHLAGTEVVVNVLDVQGYSNCTWGGHPGGWTHGKNELTGEDEAIKRPMEHHNRTAPNWRRKKKA